MNTLDAFACRLADSPNPANKRLTILIAVFLLFTVRFTTSLVHAAETPSTGNDPKLRNSEDPEIGIGIGVLTLLGADFRFFYRQEYSPWLIGYRFLDIEDDFINESASGLADDDSDKESTKRSGPYVTYLFNATGAESYYLSGALYKVTTTIECSSGKESDSATNVYLGGGFRKKWSPNVGYDIGLLLSPGANLSVESEDCSSDSDGDIDLNASLIFAF